MSSLCKLINDGGKAYAHESLAGLFYELEQVKQIVVCERLVNKWVYKN